MKIGGFVYAVCGSKEHIDTLHISLQVLKRHSQYPIWVITDTTRNESPIAWNDLIDVRTPREMSHHQASIFLKTSVHQHLPPDAHYAYLDSDILAMGDGMNGIFDHFLAPIRFAADHCTLPSFSPHAVNCGCLEQFLSEQKAFDQAQVKPQTEQGLRDQFDLKKRLAALQTNKALQAWETLRFLWLRDRYSLDDRFFYDPQKALWKNAKNEAILGSQKQLIRDLKGQVKWNRWQKQWVNTKGKPIWNVSCHHLIERIQSEFGISVQQPNWQHWNGGVFLFGPESQAFLDAWHKKCLHIFQQANWKTRDQGTLIATAWEFGLQDQILLPTAFNFLADANNEDLDFQEGQWFNQQPIQVHLAHIYHRFMDPSWPIWNRLSDHLSLKREP
jgi:hypothetical protein